MDQNANVLQRYVSSTVFPYKYRFNLWEQLNIYAAPSEDSEAAAEGDG